MNNESLLKLRQKLINDNIDAVFITNNENRRYYSDFLGSDGYMLIGQDFSVLITDSRYTEQAKREVTNSEIYITQTAFSEWFKELCDKYHISTLGFEPEYLNYTLFDRIHKTVPNVTLITMGNYLDKLRSVKTPKEIDCIKKAVKISDDAIRHVKNVIKEGMTEKALAWEIEKFMREAGSELLPFDCIVASGINSALPHHIPSDKPILKGEPVVIDIGARVDGYASDLTRTISIGPMNPEMQKIYDIVLKSQLEAEKNIHAGMTGADADKIARDVINNAGYEGCFGHALGHGIGLVCHETPSLSFRSNEILTNGMVFTVEPGIYVPELGGVRIEDTVLLENDNVVVLSQVEK